MVLGGVSLLSALAALAPAPAPEAVSAVSLTAPVLSARRAPGVLARLVADQRLRADLDAALADPALGPGRDRSCLVVTTGGRPVVARRPDLALIPASTLKVLTASAVLARIGGDERLLTEVRAAAPAGADGIVDGHLWLVGGGDPLLATADYAASFPNQPPVVTPFEHLADALVAAGVRQVRGAVVGDESRYDTQRYLPTWKPSYREDGDIGPAGALVVNDGFVAFGPRPIAAEQPALHAASVLGALLAARGVSVAGAPTAGVTPPGTTVLAAVPSPPIATVVGEMLRESDNGTAELLVKELGRRFGAGGTTADGLAVASDALVGAGLPVGQLTTVDGSGLDRGNRASCALLLATLAAAGPAGPIGGALPVAGRDGTLAPRFRGHPAAGRLRAKTGSLNGVVGLAGYLDRDASPPLSFALLANELPRDALGRRLQEDVAAALARYPDGPEPTEIGVP